MEAKKMDIYPLIFKRTQKEQKSEFSIDIQMLGVLIEMDGKKNIGSIAKKTNMSLEEIRDILLKLTELGLIEPAEDDSITFLDRTFFDYLREQLLIAIGPFADILIEDVIDEIGYGITKFPSYRVNDLIGALSKEIRNVERQKIFMEKMKKLIQSAGYNE